MRSNLGPLLFNLNILVNTNMKIWVSTDDAQTLDAAIINLTNKQKYRDLEFWI